MQKNSNKILTSIISISKSTHEAKIESINRIETKKKAKAIQEKFECTADEAIFFAILFSLYFDRGFNIDIKDIARHLECDAVELLPYEYLLSNLLKKKLIALNNDSIQKGTFSYCFRKNVIQAILTDKIPEKPVPITDNFSLLSIFRELIEEYTDKNINYFEIEEQINELIEENRHVYFAEKLHQLELSFEIKLFLIYIVVKYYKGDYGIAVSCALDDLFWDAKRHFDYVKQVMMRNETLIFEKNILKTNPAHWKNDVEVELTMDGATYLFNEDANLILVQNDNNIKNEKNIIQNETILQKELFYNEENLPTIDFIHDTLKEENYTNIKSRLIENKMPDGITILFHGKPGTGKTETVLQLAKATGRNIYRVEISELKSMWFGESQKEIKKLFSDYYKYAEKQPLMPILFFNEADAVINKRKDSNSSPVAQTENEIQNIILQEMEEFKGILIATTNLIDNIDSAFDRRFLFKLELTIPSAFTRHKIYRSFLPNLNDNDLWILAEDFNFSGGTIQNIVRKATMHHVLNGLYPDLNWYVDACKQEQFNNKQNKNLIGFKN